MIILNTFNWRLTNVTENIEFFKYQGVDAIQTSPVTECKSINEYNADKEWWKLYQILNFNIGNRLGTKDDLRDLCKESHKYDIFVFPDVVMRHVAGNDNGKLEPHQDVDKELLKYIITQDYTNPDNRFDIINGCWGMPRLDYKSTELQEKVYVPFLDELFSLGCDGFRLDMCKHYALPEEGCNIWYNVFSRYKDKFIYGECLNCPTYLLNKYTKQCKVLVDEYANMDRGSVRFFESHDTYYHSWSNTNELNDNQRLEKLSYLCKHYHNVMFFVRPWDRLIYSDDFRKVCTDSLNTA